MNGAKIYVDDAAIKRRVFDDSAKLFTFFQAISEDEPDVEDLIALEVASEDDGTDQGNSPKTAIVKNAKSATALKMWALVKKTFKEDEKFGLDKNLSAEVRHGFFSNLIRSKLEDRQLLTERDEAGQYLPNLALRQANPLVLLRIWRAIDQVFAEFSDSINRAIENAESWMKVQGQDPNATNGIALSLTNFELSDLKFILSNSTDAHQPIDAMLDLLWSKVELALSEIRRRLNVEFRSLVDDAFSRLELDLANAKEDVPLIEVMESIKIAHANFISDLDSTVGWFYRASSNYLPASSIDHLINIAIRAFERVNALAAVATVDAEQLSDLKLTRDAAKPFVIALINIFDNCLMHSGFGRASKIRISSRRSSKHFILDISNKLSAGKLISLNDVLINRINEKARSERSSILVKSEGGSGTVKAYREITNSTPNADVTFLIQGDEFIARIQYAT